MFEFPSKQELAQLEQDDTPFCVTMYMPKHELSGGMSNPNHIAFKNMVRDAEVQLEEAGADPQTITKTLQPAHELLERGDFWMGLRTSLVFFAHAEMFQHYAIPDPEVEYLVSVGKGFRVEPLRQMLEDDHPYFLLALSHHGVQLYRGGRFDLHAVEQADLPESVETALRIDEYPHHFGTHSVAPPDRDAHSEAFHGHYNKREVDKEWTTQYFRHVDAALHPFLRDKALPLVLAGVEYLIPLYREVNTYPHVCEEVLTGNFEHTKKEDLHQQSWEVVRRTFAE